MIRSIVLGLSLLLATHHRAKTVWGFSSCVGSATQRHHHHHQQQQQQPPSNDNNLRRIVGGGLPLSASSSSSLWTDNDHSMGSQTTDSDDGAAVDKQQRAETESYYEASLFVWAFVPPVLAFFFQNEIAQSVASSLDQFGFPGSNVDGNAFATNLLRPTINGVVVPAESIALGTLFATTVSVLWDRQLKMRASINKEVCELRLLRRAVFGCFGTAQHSRRRAAALGLLHSYTRTLIAETQTTESLARLEDIQMNGGISMNELDELADMLHGVDGAAASRQSSVSTAETLLVSLNGHRSERAAITLSFFPKIHWAVLIALYLGIIVSFLLDSNQDVLQYLNSIQLRVLFSIIAGVGSGAAMLLKDLQDPFEGSFTITHEAKQLSPFEELLESDMADAESESQQVGPPAMITLDRDRQRPKYNARNTVYFHLLTGPLAAKVRVLGDLFAWIFWQFSKCWQVTKRFKLGPWK